MRVPFNPPAPQVWESFFRTHAVQYGGGGGGVAFRGRRYQRGHGLGSVLGSLFKSILPAAKKVGKTVGKELLRTGAHVASDALAGENVGQSLERHSRKSAAKLLDKGMKHISKPNTATAKVSKKKNKKQQKGHGGLGFMPRKSIKRSKKRRRLIRQKVKVEDQLGSYFA